MAKPRLLRSVLEETLKSLGVKTTMKGYSLWGAWREIVGDSVASNAQPSVIRNRILFIEVSHPTWIQQLQFLKPTLLEKINGFLKEDFIHDIRFRLGKISSSPPSAAKISTWEEEDLDQTILEQIDTLLQKIDDAETRKTMRDVLVKGAKLEQYRKKSKKS
jgi:predicted nucleic acid-binding Zn ribbon protein